MFHRLTGLMLALAAVSLIAAGCGDSKSSSTPSPKKSDASMESDTAMAKKDVMEKDTAMMEKDTMAKETAMTGGKQLPLTDPRKVVVTAGTSEFGTVLFDGDGQVFYVLDKDTDSSSTCYDDCATAWPPVLADGAPTAGAGARASLVGTSTRTDGTTQLTYGGRPLYYYAHEKAGQVLCHNVTDTSGLWQVIKPGGAAAA